MFSRFITAVAGTGPEIDESAETEVNSKSAGHKTQKYRADRD